MSLYGKLEIDVEIKASTEKFHEINHKKPHHISKASSDKVQGCELHKANEAKLAVSSIGTTFMVSS